MKKLQWPISTFCSVVSSNKKLPLSEELTVALISKWSQGQLLRSNINWSVLRWFQLLIQSYQWSNFLWNSRFIYSIFIKENFKQRLLLEINNPNKEWSLDKLFYEKAIQRTTDSNWLNFCYFHIFEENIKITEIWIFINHFCVEQCNSKVHTTAFAMYILSRCKIRSAVTIHNQYITDKSWNERRFNKFDNIFADRNARWEAGKRRMSVTVPSPARREHS